MSNQEDFEKSMNDAAEFWCNLPDGKPSAREWAQLLHENCYCEIIAWCTWLDTINEKKEKEK